LKVLSNWVKNIIILVDVSRVNLAMEIQFTEIINKPRGVKCGVSDGYFNIRTLCLFVNITVSYS
jgi:hypothetical protein